MKLLLISNSTMAGEAYQAWPRQHIFGFLKRHNVKDVCFIPYAGVSLSKKSLKASYDIYTQRVAKVFHGMGIAIRSIHESGNPLKTTNYNSWATKAFACFALTKSHRK